MLDSLSSLRWSPLPASTIDLQSDETSPIPTQAAPAKPVPTPATTAAPAAALAAPPAGFPAITAPATASLLSPLGAAPAVASTAGLGGFGAFGAAKPVATLASPASGAPSDLFARRRSPCYPVKPALQRTPFRAAALRTTHWPSTGSLFGAPTSAFGAAPATPAFGAAATSAFGAAATPAFGAAPAATTPNLGAARPMAPIASHESGADLMAHRCVPVDVDDKMWEAIAQSLSRRLVQAPLAALGHPRPLPLPPRAK